MLIVLAFLVAVGFVAWKSSEWWDSVHKDIRAKEFFHVSIQALALALPLLIVETVLWSSVVIIAAGHRGVVFNKLSGMKPGALGEGIHFVTPIVEEVFVYDVRLQKVEYEATAASKDLQSVSTKVALNFRPHADSVAELHRTIGVDYAETIIHPAVQEAVKATTALYTAEELITKREEVKKQIQGLLQTQMIPAKLDLTETYITDFQFSPDFARAVESKQIAEQQAFKAQRDLDRIKVEAEQKIATAQAEAKSLALQRDAITPNLIELRRVETQRMAIDKWDGHLPQTMLGNSTPILDLSHLNKQ